MTTGPELLPEAAQGPPLSQRADLDGKAIWQPPRKKTVGREFYEKLGRPKMIVAPMVDRSEFAWRMLTRSFSPPRSEQPILAYTPMLHARLFAEQAKFRDSHFQPLRGSLQSLDDTRASQQLYLDGHPSIDRPLFVQFCANDPDELLEAARFVEPHCDAVDLNLGCPQGIARKGHYGAFLQEDWALIYKLINKLHVELSVPVTAKMRILDTKEQTLEYAKMILSAGASIITVHGRRREQKGHNTGIADWSMIRYLRDNLPSDTVIFANGNILHGDDIDRCLEETGADGVMSAEGNLSDPTLFSQAPAVGQEGREYWRDANGKGGYRVDAVLRRYMDIIHECVLENPVPHRDPLFLPTDNLAPPVETTEPDDTQEEPPSKRRKTDKGPKATSPNLAYMQGHMFQLLRPLVTKHTNVRDALARCRPGDIGGFENILTMVERAVKEGLQEYAAHPEKFDDTAEAHDDSTNAGLQDQPSSKATVAKYKRPWWICQPHVRPLPEEAIQKGALTLGKKEREKLALEAQAGTLAVKEQDPVPMRPEHLLSRDGQPKEELVCG